MNEPERRKELHAPHAGPRRAKGRQAGLGCHPAQNKQPSLSAVRAAAPPSGTSPLPPLTIDAPPSSATTTPVRPAAAHRRPQQEEYPQWCRRQCRRRRCPPPCCTPPACPPVLQRSLPCWNSTLRRARKNSLITAAISSNKSLIARFRPNPAAAAAQTSPAATGPHPAVPLAPSGAARTCRALAVTPPDILPTVAALPSGVTNVTAHLRGATGARPATNPARPARSAHLRTPPARHRLPKGWPAFAPWAPCATSAADHRTATGAPPGTGRAGRSRDPPPRG